MKNFIILLFIFFLCFWAVTFIANDTLYIFLCFYLALLIAFICLIAYQDRGRGIILTLGFVILPFVLEYLLNLYHFPFFSSSLITFLSTHGLNIPINVNNLVILFNTPAIFICSLIFAQKMKVFFNFKSWYNVFLVIASSLLVALNFLVITSQTFQAIDFFKWLIIALLVNLILLKIIKFKIAADDFFKEMPIVLYLLILASHYNPGANYFSLIITAVILIFYLVILFNEHQLKRISQAA